MSKARTLADFISDGSEFADGTISVAEVSGAAPLASPSFTGEVNTAGDIKFADSANALFGSGADLRITHDSQNSYIRDTSTGNLIIEASSELILRDYNTAENFLKGTGNGSVQLYYDGAEKISTQSDGAAITGKTTTDELDLNALAATISDTAVDIFVYDTRKDSDGGAWRKRTQHTSWYNETLNTATRGSRKEFPAVAVIVAESDTLTIYDGDDPDLPMWMVFSPNGIIDWPTSTLTRLAISALNGQIATASNDGGVIFRFIDDTTHIIYGSLTYNVTSDRSIANRNGTATYTSNGGAINTYAVLTYSMNDVAMTVLPNAPIDAATGLPVPTIAVATDGGVSVIKDDGTVVDITHTASTNNGATDISFDGNQISYATQQSGSSTNYWRKAFIDIPSADVTGSYIHNISGMTVYDARGTNSNSGVVLNTNENLGDATNNIKAAVHDAVGFTNKLTLLDIDYYSDVGTPSLSGSMVAYTTSDYATGWMNGAIQLATLSDTDDTDVTGSELVTNGTFDTDTTGWSAIRSASISIDSARLKVTNGAADNGGAQQTIIDLSAGTYVVSVAYDHNSSNTQSYLQVGTGSDEADLVNTTSGVLSNTATGVLSGTFTLSATTTVYVQTQISAVNGANGLFDNVSLRLAEEDRSVNGNGLQVFGTVTKNPVATGADLVAYSGFSTSNFLAQPPNSDFDIGTGTVCLMTWFKYAGSGNQNIVTYWDTPDYGTFTSASYGHYFQLTSPADGKINFAIGQASPASATALTTTTTYDDGQWHLAVGVRDNGVMKLYVDGQLKVSGTNTLDIDTSGTGFLIFSKFYGSIGSWGGGIALTRISTTAPSPEQIKKIYEDEKVLFQENAQATLYGESDAVTALAYDDTTELLHVGTSAGRSVFQGLRRVDNTTTAVGAAISASNGLVADE